MKSFLHPQDAFAFRLFVKFFAFVNSGLKMDCRLLFTCRSVLNTFLGVLAGVLFACNSSGQELCKDGSFDIPLRWGMGASQVFQTGEAIGFWKVESGSIELLDRGGRFLKDTSIAGKAIDLSGWQPGSVKQDITTQQGKTYVVKFSYSGNWWDNTFGKKTVVTVGNVAKEFSMEKPAGWSITSMQWQRAEFEFTANSTKSTIAFRANQLAWHHNAMLITNVSIQEKSPSIGPPALSTIAVPMPDNLGDFVKDRNAAIALGKAFFWDMQSGSDGRTACASCHHQAGIDQRVKNSVSPGASGSAFGPLFGLQETVRTKAISEFRGSNQTLTAKDFPFHRVMDPIGAVENNKVLSSSKEIVGSQGVLKKNFTSLVPGVAEEKGATVADPIHQINGVNVRQVTERHTPTNINAVFYDRLTWDGKGNHFFNGVNPLGDMDPTARVLKNTKKTQLSVKWQLTWFSWWGTGWWIWAPVVHSSETDVMEPVKISLNNAALASQSLGPQLSDVEMIWSKRTLKDFGRKMLPLKPLAKQLVHREDSALGAFANTRGPGLTNADYASLVRRAFHDSWWNSNKATDDGYTQMESNFTLFWGISMLMYQATLVSDQTPYDQFAAGNANAISESAKRGLKLFVNEGKCINCHGGPEFTTATVGNIRTKEKLRLVTEIPTPAGKLIFDTGFANIGVRPTIEDLGVGAWAPFGTLSYTERIKAGANLGQKVEFGNNDRLLVAGAMKIPTLRNIELTGPYFRHGGHRTLRETVEFYVRGADFKFENTEHISGLVAGIPELQQNNQGINDMVEFLKTLTDERVRYQRAPFDHPELVVPNGHSSIKDGIAVDEFKLFPAVGKSGGDRVKAFEEIVK